MHCRVCENAFAGFRTVSGGDDRGEDLWRVRDGSRYGEELLDRKIMIPTMLGIHFSGPFARQGVR